MAKQPSSYLPARRIADLPEQVYTHPVNPNAIRNTRSLGDALGLDKVGLHLVRLKPGRQSTEFHHHQTIDEFVYVLEGRGKARVGTEEFEIESGDCLGFPAYGPAHVLSNPFDADLLYLCGSNRTDIDICHYPDAGKRLHIVGKERHYEPLDESEET